MSSDPVAYDLPARATQDDCKALYDFLLSNDASDRIELCASDVERASVLMLQILISARHRCDKNGRQLSILAPSNAFQDSLVLTGIQSDFFEKGATS